MVIIIKVIKIEHFSITKLPIMCNSSDSPWDEVTQKCTDIFNSPWIIISKINNFIVNYSFSDTQTLFNMHVGLKGRRELETESKIQNTIRRLGI